jgi:hypothetical protein
MTVESVTYISDLNASNPAAGDAKSEGDDHIRNIKTGIKNTFPNVNAAVSATDEDLSRMAGANTATFNFSSGNMGLGMSPTYAGSGYRYTVGSIQVTMAIDVGAVGGVYGTLSAHPVALWAGGAARASVMHTGQLRLVGMASDPINGAAGDLYYNTSGVFRFHNGSDWADL